MLRFCRESVLIIHMALHASCCEKQRVRVVVDFTRREPRTVYNGPHVTPPNVSDEESNEKARGVLPTC